MTYEEALAWIHSRPRLGFKPGLDRMYWMLERLGNPQKSIRAIHVVGTNGKGSVVNNLQHIFSQAGYEVGTFTSPYIMDFRERIAINGQMISKTDLVTVLATVRPVVDALALEDPKKIATEFEVITLMMLVYFGQMHPVDIAVIEAGIGGRDDSTNCFEALAVVCPSIGLDHQNLLGQTAVEIASNKAAVLKSGEPLIMAVTQNEARQAFLDQANKVASPVYEFNRDFTLESSSQGLDFVNARNRIPRIQLAMQGQHQVANAALAIQTALLLKNDYPMIDHQAITDSLAQAKWLGRTEMMAENLMIDGAHNQESIQALVDLLKTDYADKSIEILFAALANKPVAGMLASLEEVGHLQVTQFDYPNAMSLDDYPDAYPKLASFEDWLQQVYDPKDMDTLYLVTGSLYFISQVRQCLLKD